MDTPVDRRSQDVADLNLLWWHLVRRDAERNKLDMRETAAQYQLSARLLQRVTRLTETAVPLMAEGVVLHFTLKSPQLAYQHLQAVHLGKPGPKPDVTDTLSTHLCRRFLTVCRDRSDPIDAAVVMFRLPVGLVKLIAASSLRQLEAVVGHADLRFHVVDAPPLQLLAEAAELGDPDARAGRTRLAIGTVFDPSVLAVA